MKLREYTKKLALLALTALFVAGVSGCGVSDASGTASGQKPDYTVGILQYTSHASLDEITEGVKNELEQLALANQVTIDIQVKNGQADNASINEISTMFVSDEVDLIIPIATPAAIAAARAVQGTQIPLVYSAVTDPVAAQLAQSMERPGENMTGTSDYIDTGKILELVLANDKTAKKIGVVYNLAETNSKTTVEQLKKQLAERGMEAVESTVTTPGEVQMAVQNLVAQNIDALFVPIDNTVASAMSALSDEAIKAKIPVYAAADSLVRDGALATVGVNYTRLGECTAQMAMDVLQGADPGDMPVQILNDGIVTVNSSTASALNIDPQVFDITGAGYVSVE